MQTPELEPAASGASVFARDLPIYDGNLNDYYLDLLMTSYLSYISQNKYISVRYCSKLFSYAEQEQK